MVAGTKFLFAIFVFIVLDRIQQILQCKPPKGILWVATVMKYAFAAYLFPVWSTQFTFCAIYHFRPYASPVYDRCFIETGILFCQLFACSRKTNFRAIVSAEQIQRWTVEPPAIRIFFGDFPPMQRSPFAVGIFVSCQSGTRDWSRSLSSDGFAHHCDWDRICPKRKRYHIEHRIFRKMLSLRNRIFSVRVVFFLRNRWSAWFYMYLPWLCYFNFIAL